MFDYFVSIWDQFMGSGLLEPSTFVKLMFILLFIVLPVVSLWIGIKIAIWVLKKLRDFWQSK